MTKPSPRVRGPRKIDGQLLGVAEAAQLLGLSQRAIRGRVARRLIPFCRLGGRVIFLRSDLENFVSSLPGVSVSEARQNVAVRGGEQ